MNESEPEILIDAEKTIKARAYFVGSRLNCKPFDKPGRLSPSPVFVKSSEAGYAVLFRYGVIVFLNTPQADEIAFLENIKPQISQELETYEEEFIEISANKQFKDGFTDEKIHIKSFDTARLETIAEILSRSVVLSYYEREMATTFDKIEPVTERLQKGHPSGRQVRTLLRHIGTTLSIQRKMVGQVEIYEKPEILWELPEIEPLYMYLLDEYEIVERHTALRHKLDLLYRTAETMLSLISDRRTLHVEWYIVILIVFEILITLGEKFLGF